MKRIPQFLPKWEYITPDVAEHLLRTNSKNRRISQPRVAIIAQAMKDNQYIPTHEGIGVDIDGILIDGQHRLVAILQTGLAQWILVTRGMPSVCREFIDIGKPRTAYDIAVVLQRFNKNSDFAIVRKLEYGIIPSTQWNIQPYKLFELCDKYSDGLDFISNIGGSDIKSPVSTAIVRCYLADRNTEPKLKRFVEVLKGDNPIGQYESAAVKLREFIIRNRNDSYSGQRNLNRNEILYYTTESALINFLHGKNVKSLVRVSEEKFKLPEQYLPGKR